MYWAAVATMAASTTFQILSCTLDENSVFNAFADTLALSNLRNQLLENPPFSDVVQNFDGFGGPSDAEWRRRISGEVGPGSVCNAPSRPRTAMRALIGKGPGPASSTDPCSTVLLRDFALAKC